MGMPYDLETDKKDFNNRERLTIVLIMFMITVLKPWKYNHQQSEFYDDVYSLLGLRDKK